MGRMGFFHDVENCIGCHTCQIACKDVNRLQVGENYRNVRTYCGGEGFEPYIYHLSIACNNCADPSCMAACAFDAIVLDEQGNVILNHAACRACMACVDACEYHALALIEETGYVDKCDGCATLRAQGEDPACVASCPMRVLEFGDIDMLRQSHAACELVSDAAPLPNSAKYQPSLLMRVKPCMEDRNYTESDSLRDG